MWQEFGTYRKYMVASMEDDINPLLKSYYFSFPNGYDCSVCHLSSDISWYLNIYKSDLGIRTNIKDFKSENLARLEDAIERKVYTNPIGIFTVEEIENIFEEVITFQ